MTKLQEDLLEIYNSLVIFSKETLEGPVPIPIKVTYDIEYKALVFNQRGKTVYLQLPNNYSMELSNIKDSFILPEDYDYIMSTLSSLIGSGVLLKERTTVAPVKFGFDIYTPDPAKPELGSQVIGKIRFVSSCNPIWKWITSRKYKNLI
jgi:hypothetical protein